MSMCVTMTASQSSDQNEPTLMDIIKTMLMDPDFLALSKYHQLRVLEQMYLIMENSRKQRTNHHGLIAPESLYDDSKEGIF